MCLGLGQEQGRVGSDGAELMGWSGRLDHYAQSVDQRLKCAAWIERFIDEGGTFIHSEADVPTLERLAQEHDLVIVSTGKCDLGRLFVRDAAKSPYDAPMRALALTYVTGMTPRADYSAVCFNMIPGVGEYFVFPALTTTGPCEIMVFEGIPGALQVAFYTVIPVLLVWGAFAFSNRVKNWERGAPDRRRTTPKNVKNRLRDFRAGRRTQQRCGLTGRIACRLQVPRLDG